MDVHYTWVVPEIIYVYSYVITICYIKFLVS